MTFTIQNVLVVSHQLKKLFARNILWDIVSQDLESITLVQDFKTLVFMNSVTYIQTLSDKYVAHDTDTANQVNHFQNFIAKVWKIM